MVVVELSPRRLCECGKTVLNLKGPARQEYDDAVRRLEQCRTTEKDAAMLKADVRVEQEQLLKPLHT